MTQDEIIEMARQAGMDYLQYLSPEAFEKVVVFSKLVAAKEREACAVQRPWVGLMDEEFYELDKEDLSLRQFVQAIEDKLKEKNT